MAALFISMLCGYALGNIYIFVRGLQTLRSFRPAVKWLYGTLYWCCALALMAGFALRNVSLPIGLASAIFKTGSAWLVFTLYMGMALIVFDLVRWWKPAFRHGFVVALAVTLVVLAYGHYRYRHPVVRTIEMRIDKPSADKRLRIVGVSDIHLGLGTDKRQLRKYVDLINAQQPDLIVIAGDLIDNHIDPVRRQRMGEELSQLRARLGLFLVPGNHEYISGIDECQTFIRTETPIRMLRDSLVELPNGMQLVGRDDRSNPHRRSIADLVSHADHSRPIIVIDHQPTDLTATVDARADLLFCGHTHNGQVWPMSLLTRRLYDISYGYEQRNQTHLCVSSGLSLWGPLFRIGTDSELVVFDITTN